MGQTLSEPVVEKVRESDKRRIRRRRHIRESCRREVALAPRISPAAFSARSLPHMGVLYLRLGSSRRLARTL